MSPRVLAAMLYQEGTSARTESFLFIPPGLSNRPPEFAQGRTRLPRTPEVCLLAAKPLVVKVNSRTSVRSGLKVGTAQKLDLRVIIRCRLRLGQRVLQVWLITN